MFESNLIGTHPAFYKTWIAKRTIVHEISFSCDAATQDMFFDRWVTKMDGHEYDYLGALYLGLMKLRKRLFGKPLPLVNRWAKRDTFYCNECYALVSGEIEGCPLIPPQTLGMESPEDVWNTIMAKLP